MQNLSLNMQSLVKDNAMSLLVKRIGFNLKMR